MVLSSQRLLILKNNHAGFDVRDLIITAFEKPVQFRCFGQPLDSDQEVIQPTPCFCFN